MTLKGIFSLRKAISLISYDAYFLKGISVQIFKVQFRKLSKNIQKTILRYFDQNSLNFYNWSLKIGSYVVRDHTKQLRVSDCDFIEYF
jgi:hypothetical protein